MTNKRFTYGKCIDGFYDIIDIEKNHTYPIGNMEILVMGIVELLNELSDENEQLKQQLQKIHKLIDEKILECEQAVEEIRHGEKDSYIVKHDVASRMLKELKKELES